jgi:hypothetical protein
MAVTPDGLFQFGTNQTAEVPSTPGNANDATPKAPLGALYRSGGKVWRYVKLNTGAGAVAATVYGVAHWYALDPPSGAFTVTSDYSSGIGKNLVAGIFQNSGVTLTTAYYTWIQVGGIATVQLDFSALSEDPVPDAVAGCKCSYSTTDLKLKLTGAATAATPRAVIFGVLVAAANCTAGTGSVLLQNLEW